MERTNYQARELKTVYLETHCQYIKIVCNKNLERVRQAFCS